MILQTNTKGANCFLHAFVNHTNTNKYVSESDGSDPFLRISIFSKKKKNAIITSIRDSLVYE